MTNLVQLRPCVVRIFFSHIGPVLAKQSPDPFRRSNVGGGEEKKPSRSEGIVYVLEGINEVDTEVLEEFVANDSVKRAIKRVLFNVVLDHLEGHVAGSRKQGDCMLKILK
nr:hypothetical protein [Salinibacter ruber]